jgi:hypothetical protein
MGKRSHIIALLVIASVTMVHAEMVKCKKPDGSLYVGPTPPENCTAVGNLREHPASGDSGSSWKQGDFRPTPTPVPDTSTLDAEESKRKDIETKRQASVGLVAVQEMVTQRYRNGLFFEGKVANGAAFAVYNVQICIERGTRCQPTAPSTLQPGATGTFQFEVLKWGGPDWKITWDVVPGESQ